VIQCADVVRDLGVLLDSELSMDKHISKVVSACFYKSQIQNCDSRNDDDLLYGDKYDDDDYDDDNDNLDVLLTMTF